MNKVLVYGVYLTSLQEMKFAKFRDQNGIAMNTKSKEERVKIVLDWLKGGSDE